MFPGEHQPYGGGYQPGSGTRFTTSAVTPVGPTGSWTWTVPPGPRVKLLSVYANPATGATVGNREPTLLLRDAASNHIHSIEGGPVIAASTEKELFWIGGFGAVGANPAALFTREFPLWDWVLDPGFFIKFELFGGVAGDVSGEARIFGESFT